MKFQAEQMTIIIMLIILGFTVTTMGFGLKKTILPKFDLEKWWGNGEKEYYHEDTSIRRFKIEFNDTEIDDLKQRVKNHRPFTRTLDGIQSEYGINKDFLEYVLHYWVEEYDFKRREQLLNRLPHFKTKIQGLDIHFIWEKSLVSYEKRVLPLLMLHGWPSSSKEFVKAIPLLTTPKEKYDFVFEVIAPDLPGYGFSEGTNKPGLNPAEMGIIMRNLMRRLGFERFYIQAGDWGSQVASHLATLYPDTVLGFHINFPFTLKTKAIVKLVLGSLFPKLGDPVLARRIYPLTNYTRFILRETGYFHIQHNKPDTIGVALQDSPAGLAAWIMDVMAVSTNRDQQHTPHNGLAGLDLNDVLDIITIFWVNNCIVTSMRLYAEGFADPNNNRLYQIPTKVPTAVINFRYEVIYLSIDILREKYPNLLRSTVYEFGGHFAALENPRVLTNDVFASVAKFIQFHIKHSHIYKRKLHSYVLQRPSLGRLGKHATSSISSSLPIR